MGRTHPTTGFESVLQNILEVVRLNPVSGTVFTGEWTMRDSGLVALVLCLWEEVEMSVLIRLLPWFPGSNTVCSDQIYLLLYDV